MSKAASADARLTWTVGGVLLVTTGACLFLATQLQGMGVDGVLPWLQAFSWASALGIFAVGIRGQGSVVARRPLGMAAMWMAGLLPILWMLAYAVGGAHLQTWPRDALMVLGLVEVLLPALALLVAVVIIGRSSALPQRLRWYPAIAFAAITGVYVIVQFAALAAPTAGQQVLVPLAQVLTLVTIAAPVALGILAIVTARTTGSATEPRTTQIYPPS